MRKKIILGLGLMAFVGIGLFFVIQNKRPTVSVVMPVYNRQDLVGRAIESILNQTFKDFEFIIVDDGSTDKTAEIVQSYAKNDHRIRYVTYPENRGVGYARQYGLDQARGEFVAVMDSDDWAVPERLEKSVAYMRDHPELAAMTAGLGNVKDLPELNPDHELNKVDASKGSRRRSLKKSVTGGATYTAGHTPGFYEVELAFYNSFPNVSSMYRRDFVTKHRIRYQERIISAEDYDFWRQIIMAGGRLGSIHDRVVYVRSHGSNPSRYYSAMHDNSLEIHRQLFRRFFEPTKEDLKFSYNEYEKCVFLKKMRAGNLKKNLMPQDWLDNRFKARCPENFEDSIYLEHKNWSGFLVDNGDQKFLRYGTKVTADIVLEGDKLHVIWDGWPKETFEKDGKKWKFIPKGEIIRVDHVDWKDDLLIDEKLPRVCRMGKNDCADILIKTDTRLTIKWDDPAWPIESFTYDKGDKKWRQDRGERLPVQHSDWTDTFLMRPDHLRVCRFYSADCAKVKQFDEKRMVIEWENPEWGRETFEKQADSSWRLVPEK